MDHHLITIAEAARQCGMSERTLRRWQSEGLIDRHWWGEQEQAKGPRVSIEQVQTIRGSLPSTDGRWTFEINNPRRGYVTITEADSGERSRAVALLDATIDRASVYPGGLLILTANQIGKITRNDKSAWTYMPCTQRDMEEAGVITDHAWAPGKRSLLPS